jgi:ABC-type multidrug transport system permease subunit
MSTAAAAADVAAHVPAIRPTIPRTFLAMLAREVRVMRRNFVSTFLRVVLQPLLFVFVFAYVMPKIGPGAGLFGGGVGGTTFSTILVPGLVGSAMIMQGMMAVVFPLVMELSWQRSIEDRALAPLPIELLALEKIIAGGTQALIAGLLVFPAVLFVHAEGQAPDVHVENWPLFLVVMVFGALLASSAGLYLGTVIDPRQMQMLFALVLLPATMLGCVYYPWAALQSIRWLQLAVLVNPLVYVSEGLRAVLTPQIDHMPVWAFLLVLVGGTLVMCWLAMRTFTRRVLN